MSRRRGLVRGAGMKKAGATWWGERWLAALERLSHGFVNRLSRGRTYARAGRVHGLTVRPGVIAASVTGTGGEPYDVQVTVPALSDEAWTAAIDVMAQRASIAADLLSGHMPQDIDDAFAAAGTSLFPERAVDLQMSCACPDWASPCKHVAAVHYVLGEALDGDPFLLFELRGRSKRDVLDALRKARAGEVASRRSDGAGPADGPRVPLPRMGAAAYEALRAPLPGPVHATATGAGGAVLRQLGVPPGWTGKASPEEVFGPALRMASVRASGKL